MRSLWMHRRSSSKALHWMAWGTGASSRRIDDALWYSCLKAINNKCWEEKYIQHIMLGVLSFVMVQIQRNARACLMRVHLSIHKKAIFYAPSIHIICVYLAIFTFEQIKTSLHNIEFPGKINLFASLSITEIWIIKLVHLQQQHDENVALCSHQFSTSNLLSDIYEVSFLFCSNSNFIAIRETLNGWNVIFALKTWDFCNMTSGHWARSCDYNYWVVVHHEKNETLHSNRFLLSQSAAETCEQPLRPDSNNSNPIQTGRCAAETKKAPLSPHFQLF